MPCSGRTQRGLSVEAEASPQRIDLGQGKARTIAGIASASTSAVARPGLSMRREPDAVALVELVLGQAGLAQEALQRLRRRAGARALHLLARPPRSRRAGRGRSGRGGAASRRSRSPRPSSPASASCSSNSRARSARALSCIRAGISSERSSSRKSPRHPVHPRVHALLRGSRRPHAAHPFLSIQAWQAPFARSRTRPI